MEQIKSHFERKNVDWVELLLRESVKKKYIFRV